mmetsp:Transcript_4300/g.13437  ORF Transcript_4300/g.13437 Transcript_4300/m.13437 type:complete len:355 (-) Transcript_4300:1668-2732(-)
MRSERTRWRGWPSRREALTGVTRTTSSSDESFTRVGHDRSRTREDRVSGVASWSEARVLGCCVFVRRFEALSAGRTPNSALESSWRGVEAASLASVRRAGLWPRGSAGAGSRTSSYSAPYSSSSSSSSSESSSSWSSTLGSSTFGRSSAASSKRPERFPACLEDLAGEIEMRSVARSLVSKTVTSFSSFRPRSLLSLLAGGVLVSSDVASNQFLDGATTRRSSRSAKAASSWARSTATARRERCILETEARPRGSGALRAESTSTADAGTTTNEATSRRVKPAATPFLSSKPEAVTSLRASGPRPRASRSALASAKGSLSNSASRSRGDTGFATWGQSIQHQSNHSISSTSGRQ